MEYSLIICKPGILIERFGAVNLNEDVKQWCKDTIGLWELHWDFDVLYYAICFTTETDRLAFKLRWL